MKSGKVYSLALLALACLAACGLQPSKCSRQLSDVRAYQEQEGGQISSDNENGIDAENSQGKTGNKTINGLEVPGKLTDRPEQILKRVAYTASYKSDLRIPKCGWRGSLRGLIPREKTSGRALSFMKIRMCRCLGPWILTT